MGRPRKSVSSARKNGANATNKGKRVSEAARCIVMNDNSMLERRAAAAGGVPADIKFKVILRTKLHKNIMYDDEAWAEEHVQRAARVVRELYRPRCGSERPGRMSVALACAVLDAYAVAMSDVDSGL